MMDADRELEEISAGYGISLRLSENEKGIHKMPFYKKRMGRLYDACRRRALPIVRDYDGMYYLFRRALSKAWNEIFDLAGDRRIVLCTSGNLERILLDTMTPEQRKRISLVVDQKMSTPQKYLNIGRDCRIRMRSAECYQYEKEDFHIVFFSTGKEVADDIVSVYEKAGHFASVLFLSAYMEARTQMGGVNGSGVQKNWRRLLMPEKQEKDWRVYSMLFILKKQMELERISRAYEEYCLVEIIRIYLAIRDFENAFRYMEKYMEKGFQHFDFSGLERDIKELLGRIKNRLAEDKRRNIIIRWFDALRYDEWEDMPYLFQMSEKGMRFQNAYTVMPYTSATMRTILTGKYLMNDKIYEISQFGEDTCSLLRDLDNQGYRFCIIDSLRFTKNFDERYVTHKSLSAEYTVYPLLEWTGLCEILESDPQKKLCLLIHELPETHQPYAGGNASVLNTFDTTTDGTILKNNYWTSGMITQIDESRRYVDNIFRFYKEMESESAVDIYMSDHGKFGRYGKREKTTDYENVHICLAAVGEGVAPGCEEGIFSLINFRQLIQYVIKPTKINKENCFSDYAVIQQLPVYNVYAVRRFLTTQIDLTGLMQTTGIITDKEMLLEFADGKREYYFLKDLDLDRSGEQQYQERIQYLHNLHRTKIIDVFHDDFFAASIMLYRRLGIEQLPGGEFCKLE